MIPRSDGRDRGNAAVTARAAAELRMTTTTIEEHDLARATADFRTEHYLRINARRLEHLASLGLPLHGKRVLELGAGIGDLTSFFLDRDCTVLALEGRAENRAVFEQLYRDEPRATVRHADLNNPPALEDLGGGPFDIVFCYGLLYHLSDPGACLDWIGGLGAGLVVLSTCVDPADPPLGASMRTVDEYASSCSQALDGRATRPSRAWIADRLARVMPFVYATTTQPAHPEFPLCWADEPHPCGRRRAVFVASAEPLALPTLTMDLPVEHDAAP
jgi:2-polyprenyl-3-methyl-5-hydroxy-6-metoxy-1,4-benzoquinol methylase